MALVNSDAVLTLADGSVVLPDGTVRKAHREKVIEVPTNTIAQQIVTNANKRIAELPTLPSHMNTLNVVLVYSLWGLVDDDIAMATGLSKAQVARIRAHEAYATLQRDIVQSILKSDQEDIRNAITQHSREALDTQVELMRDSDDDKVRFAASNSLLDRAGHRPNDVVEHRHTVEQALRIEVIRRDQTGDGIPTLVQNPLTGDYEDGTGS